MQIQLTEYGQQSKDAVAALFNNLASDIYVSNWQVVVDTRYSLSGSQIRELMAVEFIMPDGKVFKLGSIGSDTCEMDSPVLEIIFCEEKL